uniref:G_PROTEIN_RECEP_F1_2 domain-containing protein n=1 Tax=Rhabditophanes sp. KR3021 TaxID=114890 RepID=A0AC35TSH4_9BILA
MFQINFSPSLLNEKYSCDGLSLEEWQAEGEPNLILGIVYASLGITFIILNIPIIRILSKKEYSNKSCLKIMLYISYIDCLALSVCAVVTGYLTIIGAVYCSNPKLIYISGFFGDFGWYSSNIIYLVLAFNRCLDVYNKQWAKYLFERNKTVVWLMMAFVYGLLMCLFTPPIIYSSKNSWAWFFNPFHLITKGHTTSDYINEAHSINNFVLIIGLIGLYTVFIMMIFYKFKNKQTTFTISKSQKSLLIQSTLICSMSLIAAFTYIIMNFINIGKYIIVPGQIGWIMTHCSGAISLYFFNKTIHNHIYKDFCPQFLKPYFEKTIKQTKATKKEGHTIPTQII